MEKASIDKASMNQMVFAEWFQREYLKRRQINSSFSIRAFARFLDLEPATVSQLLSGKRKPSVKFTHKLFLRLEVTPSERDEILASVVRRGDAEMPLKSYHTIALDSFKLLADWYHYGILELTSVMDFRYDIPWIANQLDISVTEARQAIDRLLRLDLVRVEKETLVKTNNLVTNDDNGLMSTALKTLQRHVLQKALEAIDVVPQDEKDITSMTMAIDESKLPEAKKKIKNFRRQLCQFLEDGNQTRIYNLGIQIYPISKDTKRKKT